MFKNQMCYPLANVSSASLQKLQNIVQMSRTPLKCTCMFHLYLDGTIGCSLQQKESLLCVLTYPQHTKLSAPCWWTAQEKYHPKLAIPSAHDAFSKQARGTSRTMRPASLQQGFHVGIHPQIGQCFQITSFSFIFSEMPHFTPLQISIYFPINYHYSFQHHSCHCYKLFVIVASLRGCAGH